MYYRFSPAAAGVPNYDFAQANTRISVHALSLYMSRTCQVAEQGELTEES